MSISKTFVLRATPPGEGGIHVVWLSGPQAEAISKKIFPGKTVSTDSLVFGNLQSPDEKIDEVVVRRLRSEEFPFLENVIEFSMHGSMAVVETLLKTCENLGATRQEMHQLFQNLSSQKELDLCRAEAWECLLRAKTPEAARVFLHQSKGALSKAVESFSVAGERAGLQRLADSANWGCALSQPKRIVILGRANAGKSSLFNAIMGYERVIVSEVPGTTRDPVKETVNILGYPFELADTAGFRATKDELENRALVETERELREADLLIWVHDGTQALASSDKEFLARQKLPLIFFRNKSDLGLAPFAAKGLRIFSCVEGSLQKTVAVTLKALCEEALKALRLPSPIPFSQPCIFTARQREGIQKALSNSQPAADLKALLYSRNR